MIEILLISIIIILLKIAIVTKEQFNSVKYEVNKDE